MNPALKKKIYHYAMVTLACAIMGIAMNTFYMPNKMLSGGIGGVAVLAYYVAGLPMGATSLICNVPLFFLAYKYMDREYTISALYGIIAFSVSLDFFHFLSTYTVVHDKLLACIAGGMLYTTDILCHPETVVRLGEIFMLRLQELAPDCIMTVETSGIPLAMQTARAFNVPLVIARHTSDITEGSTVNINYVSGSTKVIQNMAMPKRALQPGSRVLIVDDVMKGGGTAKGMIALANEVGAQVVGKAFLIATAAPDRKLIEDYTAFFTLHNVDEEQQKVTLEVNK